jgi:hypothetical protein
VALGQSIRNAIGTVWRAALSAASSGQSAIRTIGEAVQQIGQAAAPPVLLDTSAMEQISSMAGSWVAARDALTAAADDDQVDAGMITLAPWSMDLNAYNASPGYHLVVGMKVEGQDEPVYRTITGITDLPPTVGELRAITDANAAAMQVGTTPGGGVGGTYLGIDSITITVGPALG